MSKEQVLKTLGLAYRAKKVSSGEEAVLDQLKRGSSFLVLLASDAGGATKKRFIDKTKSHAVPLISNYTAEELSHAIGKEGRKVLSVSDSNFARLLLEKQESE
ncbi:MAG TPA: ribosomal L7Ae/L30e/S12e/Gadd45 family protein [Bacillota bacterium]|nr:ribosomal L7Ae/L30e/S12e/Gadd45 family protein [Bacillota bacterium]HPF42467.1 ribosomal L7Ae/L30e/S12e/Gadd45 family protein [Bacillota bacterium]HPJ85766.1 ribosomal L7Ae/L30e/S12e/Gadd45 family protein [Bacillota bacterium]HPQ61597.1 ribosomal L7Ae/L30e/S12e/Gadd45 family protein [Bacillota bacterium]HRX91490.1 ribosomal L7Ae/L30e/S12e/Gadd45 family protein [Candidatus Izemoplasmatales bacterium]